MTHATCHPADLLSREAAFADLANALEHRGTAIAEGLWGTSARALTAALLRRRCPPVVLYTVAHIDDAEDVSDELAALTGLEADVFPAWETLPQEVDVGDEVVAGRLRVLKTLRTLGERIGPAFEGPGHIVVAPVQALLQPVPAPRHMDDNTLLVRTGGEHDPEKLRAWLAERGFEPADLVADRGQFSMRGGILDLFPPAAPHPYRIEFFGDEVESIRTFDTTTQKSIDETDEVAVTFIPGGRAKPAATVNLLNYLPEDTLTVWQDPLEVAEMGRSFVARLASPVGIYEYDGLVRQRESFRRLDIWSFAGSGGDEARFDFHVESVQRFSGKVDRVRNELTELAGENRICIFCDNEGERQRLGELVAELPDDARAKVRITVGMLLEGFRLADQGVVTVSNNELFQRYQVRRRRAPQIESRPVDSFLELKPGDHVVHVAHGIARYLGTQTLHQEGKVEDYLVLEFREQAKMYVPTSHVHLVQKYVGGFKGKVRLSKLGGKTWARQKERVKEAVQDLALEMLETEAVRSSRPGIAYPADSLWMHELEASFPYQETDDQLAAMGEIKRNMQAPRAMDRLICGDVGYGKTELAVRAAFKAAEAGRQTAILVPTTILAEQHWRTFSERLADYPVTVEMLSRFRTAREQRDVLDRVRKGAVDVVVGTHRLLSKDVEFADLGMVIVDEEQRFGVHHKERLKQFRRTVDVLTLTATPIPRTLHMSLLGIRDISSLTTPPQDRRAIRTEVCRWDDRRIREAIIRELNRDGQVFFVHNRIHNIQSITAELAALVPEARFAWAHGQMPERDLEDRMHAFLNRKTDVLVSTTIIESGLDIPTANTMFINMADLFGLAELHQLRGRIGRYKHRGYCYLLLPRNRPVRPDAVKRLKAIEEYSELGSGFQIAMRDLEIRGAGNILGAEQSGHIATVGYELFCRLLEEAIRTARGEEVPEEFETVVELGASAYLPKDYAPADRQRMTVYRMINRAHSLDVLEEVRADVVDMLGDLPPPVAMLFDMQELRIQARRWRISAMKLLGNDVVFTLEDLQAVGPLFTTAPGKVRVIDEHTVYLRMRPESTEPLRLVILMKKLFTDAAHAATAAAS